VVIGLLVAASWAWGSVQAMERNYALQKEVDFKQRQLQLAKLETQKLQYERNYYKRKVRARQPGRKGTNFATEYRGGVG